MPHDVRKYYSDMLDRAISAVDFLQQKSLSDLEEDRILRSAVERELMVLGEALFQLQKEFANQAEQIPDWQEIICFRHVLVHGYDSLRMDAIWDIVKDDLPDLIVTLRKLLDEQE